MLHKFFLFVIIPCFVQPIILCSQNIYTTNETVLKIIKKYRKSAKKQNIINKKKLLYITAGTLVVASSVAGFYLYSNNMSDESAKKIFSDQMSTHNNLEKAFKAVCKSYPDTKIKSLLDYFKKRTPLPPQNLSPSVETVHVIPPPPPPPLLSALRPLSRPSKKIDAPLRTSVLPIEPKVFEAQKLLLKDVSQRKLAEQKIDQNSTNALFKQFSDSELLNKVKKANQDTEYDSDDEWEDQ